MMEKKLSKFEKFIGQVKQEEWDQSALQLARRGFMRSIARPLESGTPSGPSR